MNGICHRKNSLQRVVYVVFTLRTKVIALYMCKHTVDKHAVPMAVNRKTPMHAFEWGINE